MTGKVNVKEQPLHSPQSFSDRARFNLDSLSNSTMKINSKLHIPASEFHRDRYVKSTMVANRSLASQGPGFPAAQRDVQVFNVSQVNGNKKQHRKSYRGEFKQDDEGLITLIPENVGTRFMRKHVVSGRGKATTQKSAQPTGVMSVTKNQLRAMTKRRDVDATLWSKQRGQQAFQKKRDAKRTNGKEESKRGTSYSAPSTMDLEEEEGDEEEEEKITPVDRTYITITVDNKFATKKKVSEVNLAQFSRQLIHDLKTLWGDDLKKQPPPKQEKRSRYQQNSRPREHGGQKGRVSTINIEVRGPDKNHRVVKRVTVNRRPINREPSVFPTTELCHSLFQQRSEELGLNHARAVNLLLQQHGKTLIDEEDHTKTFVQFMHECGQKIAKKKGPIKFRIAVNMATTRFVGKFGDPRTRHERMLTEGPTVDDGDPLNVSLNQVGTDPLHPSIVSPEQEPITTALSQDAADTADSDVETIPNEEANIRSPPTSAENRLERVTKRMENTLVKTFDLLTSPFRSTNSVTLHTDIPRERPPVKSSREKQRAPPIVETVLEDEEFDEDEPLNDYPATLKESDNGSNPIEVYHPRCANTDKEINRINTLTHDVKLTRHGTAERKGRQRRPSKIDHRTPLYDDRTRYEVDYLLDAPAYQATSCNAYDTGKRHATVNSNGWFHDNPDDNFPRVEQDTDNFDDPEYSNTSSSSSSSDSRKKRRKRRRRPRSFSRILADLYKNATTHKLQKLGLSGDGERNKQQFSFFKNDLTTILNLTKETAGIIDNNGTLRRPSSDRANHAFHGLITAFIGPDLKHLVDTATSSDGVTALQTIQNRCCPQNTDTKEKAKDDLKDSKRVAGEKIRPFSIRWNRLSALAKTNGVCFDHAHELIGMYLHSAGSGSESFSLGLKMSKLKDQHVQWLKTPTTPYPLCINRVQEELAEAEDQFAREEASRRNYNNTTNFGRQRERAQAHQAHQQNPQRRCFGCQSMLHTLSQCPTTPREDRDRIWRASRTNHSRPNGRGTGRDDRDQGRGHSAGRGRGNGRSAGRGRNARSVSSHQTSRTETPQQVASSNQVTSQHSPRVTFIHMSMARQQNESVQYDHFNYHDNDSSIPRIE